MNKKIQQQYTGPFEVAFSQRVYLYADVEFDGPNMEPENVIDTVLNAATYSCQQHMHIGAETYTFKYLDTPIGELCVQIQLTKKLILVFFADEDVNSEGPMVIMGQGGMVPVTEETTAMPLNTRRQETLH